MTRLARFSLVCGALFLLVGTLVLGLYYFEVRSSYVSSSFYEAFRASLLDPDSPPEQLREFALKAHEGIFAGWRALDAAVNFLAIVSFAAGGAFVYVFRSLRSQRARSASE